MPRLFAYGTLRDESVQRAVFGRVLYGQPDAIARFEKSLLEFPATGGDGGTPVYPVVRFNDDPDRRVDGIVYELTDRELEAADEYETSAYRRILVELVSGSEAWVYVEGEESVVSSQ